MPWNTKINDNINLNYIAILLQLIYVWPMCFAFAGSTFPSALAHKDITSADMLDKSIRTFSTEPIWYTVLAHYD